MEVLLTLEPYRVYWPHANRIVEIVVTDLQQAAETLARHSLMRIRGPTLWDVQLYGPGYPYFATQALSPPTTCHNFYRPTVTFIDRQSAAAEKCYGLVTLSGTVRFQG